MTLIAPIPSTAPATPTTVNLPDVSATAVMDTLWRVCAPSGNVLGHIHRVEAADGERFAAHMLLPGGLRTLFLGEFWNLSDAIETFR